MKAEVLRLYTAANILVCDNDKTYTVLNRYNPKTHAFEGEYSLIHNEYTNDSYFLSRFLLQHHGHHLVLLNSDDERYYEIKQNYHHFEEEDISRYMEELAQRRAEDTQKLSVKQNVGQLQILVARKMIEQEWEAVQEQESSSERDTYVLLGQDYAFRWSVQAINRILEFGDN